MILTSSYSRIQADSPESFLGWRHFIHELNQFLNKNVTKDTQGLEYAVLGSSQESGIHPDQAVIQVYTGKEDSPGYNPEKLISGTKYFLGEHGLKILKAYQDHDVWETLVSGLPIYNRPQSYQGIKNTWMKNHLLYGDIIDVRQVGVETEPGVFKLNSFIPGIQYVDPEEEKFIFSIGKDKESGEIFAAYDTRFYGDDDYETLYLH